MAKKLKGHNRIFTYKRGLRRKRKNPSNWSGILVLSFILSALMLSQSPNLVPAELNTKIDKINTQADIYLEGAVAGAGDTAKLFSFVGNGATNPIIEPMQELVSSSNFVIESTAFGIKQGLSDLYNEAKYAVRDASIEFVYFSTPGLVQGLSDLSGMGERLAFLITKPAVEGVMEAVDSLQNIGQLRTEIYLAATATAQAANEFEPLMILGEAQSKPLLSVFDNLRESAIKVQTSFPSFLSVHKNGCGSLKN